MKAFSLSCWCGNTSLLPFSPDYYRCSDCESLVSRQTQNLQAMQITDEDRDFYGRKYYETHLVEKYHYPPLAERARGDLPERCLHWLRALLRYKLPPARILELGSAHGGFVAMLRWVGFDASGLELSPWLAEFARQTFRVPMLVGPLEDQTIAPGSLDVIALMDVLEHLPDPVKTMRRCLNLLAPDGIFLIQTPRYPEGKSHAEMTAQNDPFLQQLKIDEHVYLFSKRSIAELFSRLEARQLAWELPIFAHYDMFLAMSRTPLRVHSPEEINAFLEKTPEGRMARALLDLDGQRSQLLDKFRESEADRAFRQEIINRTLRELEELQKNFNSLTREWKKLQESFPLWAMRKCGFFKGIDWNPPPPPSVSSSRPSFNPAGPIQNHGRSRGKTPKRIAADLIALLPGAENGGAKMMTMELIRYLSRILPHSDFILLTADWNHEELSSLDARNVRRVCVHRSAKAENSAPQPPAVTPWLAGLKGWATANLPSPILSKAKYIYWLLQGRKVTAPAHLRRLEVDLLFCPFTLPFFHHPEIRTVSIVYDLQFEYYPQFFPPDEYESRARHFAETCRLADRLICISDFVRDTVLQNSSFPPERIFAIPIRLAKRLPAPSAEAKDLVLQRYGLQENQFLFYPGNFWPHKNHALLFTAFGIYRRRHPESALRLACTGWPDKRMEEMKKAALRMGLEPWIVFPGFLTNPDFAALLASCQALIFPSLYEGFGMPVLEAMSFDKPVLCSNVTSLPEVAGDAALYFDPKRPEEILRAIERIAADKELRESLTERGRNQFPLFADPERMAREYLTVFQEALE